MTTQERALKLIQECHNWNPGEPSNLSEAGFPEKCRMIAGWGLSGDSEKLTQAGQALGLGVDV